MAQVSGHDDNFHKTLLAIINGDPTDTLNITGRDLTNAQSVDVSIVDGAGNQVTSFGGSGGTSATDDSAFTAGSGSGTPVMGFFSTDTVDSGDVGVLAMDASRRMFVSLEVDNIGLTQVEDAVHGSGDGGVMALAVRQDSQSDLAADGDYIPMTINASGELRVTTGAGTPYTEDVATANPIVGTATMIERDDALSTVTPIEGDWISLRGSAEGALWVQDFNSDAILADTASMDTNLGTVAGAVSGSEMQVDIVSGNVTNAGTFVVQEDGAALTALQLIDDIVFTDDTSTHATGTTKGAGIMAAATPTDGSVAANDIGMLAMSTDRRLHVDADITASVALDVSAATVTVDNGGTFVVQEDGAALTALQLIDDIVSTDDTTTHATGTTRGANMMAAATPTDGSVAANDIGMVAMSTDRRLHTDTQIVGQDADITIADGGNSITVDNAGTFVVQEDGAALTALQLIDNIVQAEDAVHGSGDSGVMALAVRQDSQSDLAADGDYIPMTINASGELRVTTGSGTAYTEDVATPNPIVGTATMMERDDALATLTPIEGDWVSFRSSAEGALWVQDFNSDAILADTANMDTNLGTVAGAVSGSEMQVDIVSGNVTNAGTFVVQEDGAALTALQLIDNIVQAEDAVHGSGDSGVMALAVRQDSQSDLAADGDYIPMTINASGELRVTTGAGTPYTEDVATANPIVGTATMMERDDALATVTPIEGDWISFRGTAEGALWTQDFNSDAILADTTAILADTAAIQTAVEIIDNPVFADDAAFTLTSSSVMVGGAIRDDSLSTLTAIEGDAVPLRVGSTGALHVTGGGGGTEYTEDVATANPIVGTATMMERDDALSTVTPIEGDWISFRGTAEGALWTQDFNSDAILADTTAILADTAAIQTAVEIIDNPVFVDNAGFTLSTSSVMVAGGVFQSGTPGTLADNDAGAILLNSTAGQMVELMAGTASIGTLGSNDAVDIGDVSINEIIGVTFTNDGIQISGDEASDAVDAGNPVKIGGRAQEPTGQLEEVADNDRADGAFDRQGRLAVWMGYPVQSADINDAVSGNNTIQAAAGAGLRIAVMGYHIVSDGTVDFRWEDGAGGTALTGQIPLQAREGLSAGYGFQPMWVGSANTLLNLELSAATNVHGQVSFVVMTD